MNSGISAAIAAASGEFKMCTREVTTCIFLNFLLDWTRTVYFITKYLIF